MSWETMKFIDFILLQRGHDLTKEQIKPGIYPVVTSTSIMGFHNAFKAEGPGVITGRSGTIGEVQYVESNYWPHNTSLYVKDFKGNCPRFVYYFMKNFGTDKAKSGSAVPTLNRNSLSGIDICVPDVETQCKIADILSAYDNLIENNQKQIKLLEEAAQRLYKEWFVDLRFPGYEDVSVVDGVPEGWRKYAFSEKVSVMSGGTPKTDNADFYNGDIPFYTPKDSDGSFWSFDTITHISEAGLKSCNSKYYLGKTVIITARGTVGKTTLLAVPMAMNQSCYALKCDDLNAPFYLFFSLNKEVEALKVMANGGVFNTIIVKTFDSIFIDFPAGNLVERFENQVEPIMKMIACKMRENIKISEARDRLLPKLMSGEIEV